MATMRMFGEPLVFEGLDPESVDRSFRRLRRTMDHFVRGMERSLEEASAAQSQSERTDSDGLRWQEKEKDSSESALMKPQTNARDSAECALAKSSAPASAAHEKVCRSKSCARRQPEWMRGVVSLPVMDLYETPEGYAVRVELPGVPKSKIEVSVEGDVITIEGVREDPFAGARTVYLHESASGKMARSVIVPKDASAHAAHAEFENGVLLLRIPRTQPQPPARSIIDIK